MARLTMPYPTASASWPTALAAILIGTSACAAVEPEQEVLSVSPTQPATLRMSYSVTTGHIERELTSSVMVSSGKFTESALSLAWTGPLGSLFPGAASGWSAELAAEYGLGVVGNSNHADGRMDAFRILAGTGPTWTFLATADEHLDLSLIAFGGLGGAVYANDFSTSAAGVQGETRVQANGPEASYGAKLAARWIWTDGWGESLCVGVARRHIWLSGDTVTQWSNGSRASDNYASEDVISAVFASFAIEQRF